MIGLRLNFRVNHRNIKTRIAKKTDADHPVSDPQMWKVSAKHVKNTDNQNQYTQTTQKIMMQIIQQMKMQGTSSPLVVVVVVVVVVAVVVVVGVVVVSRGCGRGFINGCSSSSKQIRL